jgi:hypothetical protein
MDGPAEFTLGSEVLAEDGNSYELRRLVVDPTGRVLTHVVIVPRHQGGRMRLAPATMVDPTPDGLRMRCTTAEFEALTAADETEFVVDPTADPSAPPNAVMHHGDRAHALDGGIGRFKGLIVMPDDRRVTHVLLDEGFLWNRRRIVVPIDSVTDVADGVHIGLTKDQMHALTI